MSEERMNPNFNLESCLRNKVNEAKRYLEDKHKRQKDGACEESSYAESFIYYFQNVETMLDLYKKEKEDNKLYKLCMIQDQDFRDRLIDILGVGDNEETILQYIATLVSEKKGINELKQELLQEKEKNKELEEKLKISIAMLTKGTYPETEKGANDFDNYYISKDKIREKIESIENMSEIEVCDEEINYKLKIEDKAKKEVLKELLEED